MTRDTTLAAAGGSVAQLLYLDSRLLCSQNLQSQEIWRKANFLIGTEQLRGPTSPIPNSPHTPLPSPIVSCLSAASVVQSMVGTSGRKPGD